MKMILASLIILAAPMTFAKCPAGTTREATCTLNLQAGDDDVVSQNIPKVVICSGDTSVSLVLTLANGKSATREAQVERRVGATTLKVSEPEDHIVISVVRGVGPNFDLARVSVEKNRCKRSSTRRDLSL